MEVPNHIAELVVLGVMIAITWGVLSVTKHLLRPTHVVLMVIITIVTMFLIAKNQS